MRVVLYSEDIRDGLAADWPAIPRQGEFVALAGRGTLKVGSVRWSVQKDGTPVEVELVLTD